MKAEQLRFQVYYKLQAKVRRQLGKKEKYTYYKEGSRIAFFPFLGKQVSYKGDDTFCFLNLTHRFDGAWDDRTLGDLWRYNLNYMDFLLQPSMDVAEGVAWIERFIDAANVNKIASDPYPISLRGINWIKFVSLHWDELSDVQRRKIDTSLYSQYRMLGERTERHLLANHYLENGFSLLFAAVYFRDEDFWNSAKSIIESQLEEQILNDGAHYELSPMYHCIILERLLDCYNLLLGVENVLFDGQDALKGLLLEKACLMLGWLDAIVTVDNLIPLLNDSAYGVALSPEDLWKYAMQMDIEWEQSVLADSGYRRVLRPCYEAFLDMAPLGPSYNLGHAHADTGTFLLWVDGRELLVDTGTSTYNAGKRRDYERSTRAHNAVVVDGENSSKVWGAFRCAQRAQAVIRGDGPTYFSMAHDGYHHKYVSYGRSFICERRCMKIIDTVLGAASHVSTAYFHLAPDVQILKVEEGRVTTDMAVFTFVGYDSIQLIDVEVAREYNVLLPSKCIQVKFSSLLYTLIDGFEQQYDFL